MSTLKTVLTDKGIDHLLDQTDQIILIKEIKTYRLLDKDNKELATFNTVLTEEDMPNV